MSWTKATDVKKKLIAPDGKTFIYPDELYVNDTGDEYLFKHLAKYYIITSDTQYKLKFTTNSEELLTKYDNEIYGTNFIAKHCINNESESSLNFFDFGGVPASKIAIDIESTSFPTEYVVFFFDGSYRMRLESLCDGSELKYLHAKYYWTQEAYDSTFNPLTFNFAWYEGDPVMQYINSNNTSGLHTTWGDDLFLKASSLDDSWLVDYDVTSQAPPSDWETINVDGNSNRYSLGYRGVAQSEYTISSEIVVYNLFESTTLLGEYTATDSEGEDVTRTVGWLKFTDTENKEYIKEFDIYKNNQNQWFAGSNELSNEPTADTNATYTIDDKTVTVSFDEYTTTSENFALLSVNAFKGIA